MLKTRKLFAGTGIIVILIIAGVVLIIHLLSSPAEGTVLQTATPVKKTSSPNDQPGQFLGKYIAFNFPAHYQKIPSPTSTDNHLELVNYYSNDGKSRHIAVEVFTENLTSDSGYNLRLKSPNYHPAPSIKGATIFTNSVNGTERTAYLVHYDMVASISISTPFQTDLTSDLNTIVNSLVWE